MNGGTFTPGIEKERAGIYFRFFSAANLRLSASERGTVALPLVIGWGEEKKFISISSAEDVNKKLGLQWNDPTLLLLREAKKRSQTVLLYRVNVGEKAAATIALDVNVTAKHSGSKGNDIQIRVSDNVLDETKKDVITLLDNQEVHRQTVALAADLVANDWVEFSGEGALELTAGTNLEGGSDGTAANGDYTDFFADAETEYFDTIGLPVDDDQLKATFVSFVKRLRDSQGIRVAGVLADYPGDYEGITNVTNGVVLESGQTLSPYEAVAWTAGASAGATIHQSLTFMDYDGAIDASPRYDNDATIERLRKGEFMFTFDPRERTVAVEKDINSFVSVSSEKDQRFQKNKIIRILDGINNDLRREITQLIKNRKNAGQDIPVNADGLALIKTLITVYMNTLQDGQAVKNFDPQEDIQMSFTDAGDGFIINLGAQPVDSAEKFYFGVEVR